MKIVVIGGSGLIGTKVVKKLTERGHEALPASPNKKLTGIDREDHFLRGVMTKLYLFVAGVLVVLSQPVAGRDMMGTWQGIYRSAGY